MFWEPGATGHGSWKVSAPHLGIQAAQVFERIKGDAIATMEGTRKKFLVTAHADAIIIGQAISTIEEKLRRQAQAIGPTDIHLEGGAFPIAPVHSTHGFIKHRTLLRG